MRKPEKLKPVVWYLPFVPIFYMKRWKDEMPLDALTYQYIYGMIALFLGAAGAVWAVRILLS
jgi:hypothetical protein